MGQRRGHPATLQLARVGTPRKPVFQGRGNTHDAPIVLRQACRRPQHLGLTSVLVATGAANSIATSINQAERKTPEREVLTRCAIVGVGARVLGKAHCPCQTLHRLIPSISCQWRGSRRWCGHRRAREAILHRFGGQLDHHCVGTAQLSNCLTSDEIGYSQFLPRQFM